LVSWIARMLCKTNKVNETASDGEYGSCYSDIMFTTSGASDAYTRIYCDWTGSHPLLSTTLYKELPANGTRDDTNLGFCSLLTYHSEPNISRIPIRSLRYTGIEQQPVAFGIYSISDS